MEEKEKKQVFMIHGGVTFKNQEDYLDYLNNRNITIDKYVSWSGNYLREELKDNFTIIKPRMPLQDNAKYKEWKIHFERYFDLLDNNIILIGSSLGGIFLVKYLSENVFPKKILSVYLIAPPFDDTIIGEKLVGGFELQSDLSMIEKNCDDVILFFSKDDNCIPVTHAKKYQDKLKNSKVIIYESKNGHFRVEEFPEIVDMIKNDLKK